MPLTLKAPDNTQTKVIMDALAYSGNEIAFEPCMRAHYALCAGNHKSEFVFYPPFKTGAIIDQAKKMLRDISSIPSKIKIGDAFFYKDDARFETGDTQIFLTEKETSLLLLLWQNIPAIVTKDTLLKAIWEYQNDLETHTLETHIYRLRQKIETDPAHPKYLLTEKHGYRLCESAAQ